MNRRASYAVAVIAAIAVVCLLSARSYSDSDKAYFEERFTGKGDYWARVSDTTCAAVAETLTGPSVYIFGAAQVIARIQANSGVCSLVTWQMSQNDTNYTSTNGTATSTGVKYYPGGTTLTVGDSLNRGGIFVLLHPQTNSANDVQRTQLFGWRYARVFVTTRTGYTTATASAGPTVACRTKLDSLRISYYVQRNAP